MSTNLPPSKAFPQLFKKVHDLRLFSDAKLFADSTPKFERDLINEKFNKLEDQSKKGVFEFVEHHFELARVSDSGFSSNRESTVSEHVNRLWPFLTREKDVAVKDDSRISLPFPYIVPGGRFNEIYYWDSYFTMLGLKISGLHAMIANMVVNFDWFIHQFGHIPNGNRSYYTSRSQPPFFSLMVKLLAEVKGEKILEKYLPAMVKEHSFWMKGSFPSAFNTPTLRIVKTDSGAILNRYWDNLDTPRDEMYPDDIELAKEYSGQASNLFRHIRAACESGWDFSTRWFESPNDLSSIEAGNIIPIDLNCLLYHLELTISEGYSIAGKSQESKQFLSLATQRKHDIISTFWNEKSSFFFDYNFKRKEQTNVFSLAATFPLFFNIATQDQADSIALTVEEQFLKNGGLISTTIHSGQQWDAPNGWAPLQYMAIKGLLNYGHRTLANEIASRWLSLNETVFKSTGKMMEKYNVEDTNLHAGGGEYPVQDGFGWTNGVYLALKNLGK